MEISNRKKGCPVILLNHVQEARERITPYIVRTPLIRVPALDQALGCQVYLKHEGFQAIGAFKIRGAMNKALFPRRNVPGGWSAPPPATTPRA